MTQRFVRVGLVCGFAAMASTAVAQLPTVPAYKDAAGQPQLGIGVGIISGSVTASLAGFQPTAGATAALTAGTTSSSVNLPSGSSLALTNNSSQAAQFRLTTSASTALTTDQTIPGNSTIGLSVGTNTVLSAITTTGTANLSLQGGTGLVTGFGGGSAGGGGGNVNLTGINGVTPLAGAGATGTGSLRVTSSQDTNTIAGSAPGTAGAPSSNVLTVQGVSGGTVLPMNQTQVNGSATPTGAGVAATAGTQRVVAAQDTTTIAGSPPGTAGTASTSVVTVQGIAGGVALPVSGTLTNASVGTNGSASPTNSTLTAYQNGSGNTVQDSSTNPHPVADSALLAAAQAGTGTNGSAAPGTSVLVSGKSSAGNLTPFLVTSTGLSETQDTGSTSNNSAFQGAVAMTVGTTYTAQRAVGANCTVAGNVTVTLADASTISWPVAVGWNREAFASTGIASSGTTATCTYSNLK